MPDTLSLVRLALLAILPLCAPGTSLSAAEPAGGQGAPPPAGQMCPRGAFVIGFDADSNIVCSAACGNGTLDTGEGCDDGNTRGDDGCSANCQREVAAVSDPQEAVTAAQTAPPAAGAGAVVATSTPTPAPVPAATATPSPPFAITDVEPSSVVFGTRELTIRISGTGFDSATVVLFEGSTYQPTVNPAGTELEVTLSTRRLALGNYAIKVSNGPGEVLTRKKALVVY